MQLLKLALPLFVASLISAAPLPKDHNVGAQDMLKWTVPVDSLPHDLLLGYKGRDVQDEVSQRERYISFVACPLILTSQSLLTVKRLGASSHHQWSGSH